MARTPSVPRSSWARALTVPWVATGMKTGVSTSPCGVDRTPARAREDGSCAWTVKLTGSEGEGRLLRHAEAVQPGALLPGQARAVHHHLVDLGVRAVLVVVEEPEAPHSGLQGQPDGLLVGGVPPGPRPLILRLRELRVVNEDLGVGAEGRVLLVGAAARMAVAQLVVREEDEGAAVLLELVAQALVGMAQDDRGHLERADLEALEAGLVELELRLDGSQVDRELGRLHDLG